MMEVSKQTQMIHVTVSLTIKYQLPALYF